MRWAALLLAVAAAGGCAHAPSRPEGRGATATVVAEGWAAWSESDPARSRRAALADAQRKAVEEATGVRVSARTTVEGAVAVESVLEAEVAGRLRSYETLGERRLGRALAVRIRARVALGEESWEQGRGPLYSSVLPPAAERGLRRALESRGWRRAKAGPGVMAVTGEASAAPVLDPRLAAFRSWRARVAVEARPPRAARGLFAEGEASAADLADDAARDKALEEAGAAAGEALAAGYGSQR